MNHRALTWRRAGRKGRQTSSRQGFTLVEVMFASVIALLLTLVLFETFSVCQRIAADIKWRLAADALAYDLAWETFNRQTSCFVDSIGEDVAEWAEVPEERTSVWYKGGAAYYMRSITPVGEPITHWVIRTNVQWPVPGGGSVRLPNDYVIERYRADRNVFRAGL